MKPSDFTEKPYSFVFLKSEHETIARNCMVIQKKMGDEWKKLSWDDYCEYRKKDGATENQLHGEKKYFDDVVEYTESPEDAMSFAPTWRNIYKQLKKEMVADK